MNDDYGRGFACKSAWEKRAPILHVFHELDGDWSFICDGSAHPPGLGDEHAPDGEVVLIHTQHVFDRFPDVSPLSTLRPGEWASREDIRSPWVRQSD